MRRIQFRIWETSRKRMTYETPHISITLDGRPRFISEREALIEGKFWPDDLVLEQFTGLQDKNGRDIYEGDILSYGRRGGIVADEETYIASIIYSYKHARFLLKREESLEGLVDWQPQVSTFEVIGNIHENPELLS